MSEAETTTKKEPAAKRPISMNDGRTVEFGLKQKMRKGYETREGVVYANIDFDNGQTIEVGVDPTSEIARFAIGHGLIQKLGDAAASADNTDDAIESILEVANRIAKGTWNQVGEGTGSAKGSSDLLLAMCEYTGNDKDTMRDLMANVSPAEKTALRKVPDIAAIIAKIVAAKGPSKAEADKVAKASDLANMLKAGIKPEAKPVVEEEANDGAGE